MKQVHVSGSGQLAPVWSTDAAKTDYSVQASGRFGCHRSDDSLIGRCPHQSAAGMIRAECVRQCGEAEMKVHRREVSGELEDTLAIASSKRRNSFRETIRVRLARPGCGTP
jgi:hypothetical protein